MGELKPDVDLQALNEWFADIPPGPYDALNTTGGWEVRQIDTDPANKHHWPFRLCSSITGQTAGCDAAVFSFIAGVINAWPHLLDADRTEGRGEALGRIEACIDDIKSGICCPRAQGCEQNDGELCLVRQAFDRAALLDAARTEGRGDEPVAWAYEYTNHLKGDRAPGGWLRAVAFEAPSRARVNAGFARNVQPLYASPIREPEISREAVARIIDPEAWEEYLLEDGRVDQEVASIFQDAYETSLIKADAILNLAPVGGRGDV